VGEGGGGEGGGGEGGENRGKGGRRGGDGGGDGEGGVVITSPSGVHKVYRLNQVHCQKQLSEQHGLPVADQHKRGWAG